MSIMQAIWDPPNVGHHHSPLSAHHMQMHSHHFHFPPTSLLDASASFSKKVRAVGQKLSHYADGERGAASRGRVSSWSPDTDIRQTKYAYHIEIEVPGTTDKETLLIQWLSPSTLIVRGEIERPFVGHGKAAEGAYQGDENGDGYAIGNPSKRSQDSTHEHDGSTLKENEHDSKHVPHGFTDQSSTRPKQVEEKTTDDGGELKRMITDPGEECADIPMFLLEERKTGPWQRTFTLPHNIEMKALKARLEGGLLKIDIPIRDASEKPGMKIEIE